MNDEELRSAIANKLCVRQDSWDSPLDDIMQLIASRDQQIALEARLEDFTRMEEYYGRGNLKLWDEPDNNDNSVYLGDYIATLKSKQKGTTNDK